MVAENRRDELARVLLEHHSIGVPFYEALADAILSSSWLAGQLKQARADALEEAAQIWDGYAADYRQLSAEFGEPDREWDERPFEDQAQHAASEAEKIRALKH